MQINSYDSSLSPRRHLGGDANIRMAEAHRRVTNSRYGMLLSNPTCSTWCRDCCEHDYRCLTRGRGAKGSAKGTVLVISSGERFSAPRAARSSTTEFYTTLRTRRTQGKNISPVMAMGWSRAMACGGSTEPWEVSLDVLAFVWWLRGHGRWIYSYRNLSRHAQGSDEGKDSRGLGVRVVMREWGIQRVC